MGFYLQEKWDKCNTYNIVWILQLYTGLKGVILIFWYILSQDIISMNGISSAFAV